MESKKYRYRIVTTPTEGLFMPQRGPLEKIVGPDDWTNCWFVPRPMAETRLAIAAMIVEDNFTPEVVAE